MHRLFPILLYERYRRYKKFIIETPFLVIGLLSSAVFMLVGILTEPVCVSGFLDQSLIVFAAMAYLVAKIINPTQGMTLDYQLLELKLISLNVYKIMLGVKLFGGSIVLSLICLNSYTKMVVVISALNIVVNVWVFLRNRWDNRIYDLFIVVIVVVCIKYQALLLSVLSMILISGVYFALKRVNYNDILSLYKLIYKIGQQRYNGVVYSEAQSWDIRASAETLIYKAKEKHSDWCEHLFDRGESFMMYKELVRVMANFDKIVTCFIICIVIGMSGFYIPNEYVMMVFTLLAIIAMNFDMIMNRSEAKLLRRGFIGKYIISDILRHKIFVYTIVNFIFMFPSLILGWKWLILAFISSFFIALVSLYKCFRVKES